MFIMTIMTIPNNAYDFINKSNINNMIVMIIDIIYKHINLVKVHIINIINLDIHIILVTITLMTMLNSQSQVTTMHCDQPPSIYHVPSNYSIRMIHIITNKSYNSNLW